MDGRTQVVLDLSRGGMQSEQVHIHQGQCGNRLAGVEYPLTSFTVGSGISITLVDAQLRTLRDGNHAINVHKAGDTSIYTACANIPRAAPISATTPTATPVPTPTPTPRPVPTSTPLPGLPAGSFVEIQYNHWLGFNIDGRAFEEQWAPGVVPYDSRWNFNQPDSISLAASFDGPLDLARGDRPLSLDQAQGKYSYSWLPAPHISLTLQRQLAADAGLLLSRTITPNTLPPGSTQVVIDVTVEIVRPPTVSGITVRPVGGDIHISVGGGEEFRSGAESQAFEVIRPARIISVSGPVSTRLGPLFEAGAKYTLRTEAVIENPNLFPVSYLPNVNVSLDFDTVSDAAPFKVAIPSGRQANAPAVSFDAVGIAGVGVEFTFSNPSHEKVFWVASTGGFIGLLQFWGEQLRVAP